MKLRMDYVTNSSSVSYIITMHEGIVDCFLDFYQGYDAKAGTIRMAKAGISFLRHLA